MDYSLDAESYRLRPNADTSYQDARDWYMDYGWHLDTDREGAVCLQAIDYDWLDHEDDADVVRLLRKKLPGLRRSEAEIIIRTARMVREAADDLEGMLEEAVDTYDRGDLPGVLAALKVASSHERGYGDDPATEGLASELLDVVTDQE